MNSTTIAGLSRLKLISRAAVLFALAESLWSRFGLEYDTPAGTYGAEFAKRKQQEFEELYKAPTRDAISPSERERRENEIDNKYRREKDAADRLISSTEFAKMKPKEQRAELERLVKEHSESTA